MRRHRQLFKYIASDFCTAALAWLMFNVIRYELVAHNDFESLSSFLLFKDVIRGQILIPIGWLILHYYSGYYNETRLKSRLTEFFTTLAATAIGVIIIFFTVVLKTLPPSIQVYYEQFLSLFLVTFIFTYFSRLWITVRIAKKLPKLPVPLMDVAQHKASEVEKNIKGTADRIIALLVLILLSPLYLYLSIRVKLESNGSVFFKQDRIGRAGKSFMIYKFRTMYCDAEKDGPTLSTANDARVTPLGHYMRKYRLDELPQFWNVLKGDMSLVGHRPERKFYIDQIILEAPNYRLLYLIRPGITSLGMVKYGYASTVPQMIERLQYDILYYENRSLALDIKILIYTVRTIVTGKGI